MELKVGLEYLSYLVNLIVAASWSWKIGRDLWGRRTVRRLVGKGRVTIHLATRQNSSGRRVIANEDFFAALELADFLRKNGVQCDLREIPPNQDVDFEKNSVVICGPKSSEFVKSIYRQDGHYTFELVNDAWVLVDQATGNHLVSPLDRNPPEEKDLAYLGRARNRGGHPYLMLAGLHAIGSFGAVQFLSNRRNIKSLVRKAGDQDFSTILVTTFNRQKMKVLKAEIFLPVRCR